MQSISLNANNIQVQNIKSFRRISILSSSYKHLKAVVLYRQIPDPFGRTSKPKMDNPFLSSVVYFPGSALFLIFTQCSPSVKTGLIKNGAKQKSIGLDVSAVVWNWSSIQISAKPCHGEDPPNILTCKEHVDDIDGLSWGHIAQLNTRRLQVHG